MTQRGSDILAWTVSYGDRPFLRECITQMRGTAGCWMDWFVALGAPSPRLQREAEDLLNTEDGTGIQHLLSWRHNRGQHHAFKAALDLAREREYKWLLRVDDDVRARTKNWLLKMVSRLEELKALKGDEFYRFVASPKVVGLKNPLHPVGEILAGQKFPAEIMPLLGGTCRLHPVELLEQFEPPLYESLGRGDPQAMDRYLAKTIGGHFVRFPDIRVSHNTAALEAAEDKDAKLRRRMGRIWCYLGEGL